MEYEVIVTQWLQRQPAELQDFFKALVNKFLLKGRVFYHSDKLDFEWSVFFFPSY
jgi:hypothetical protein